MRCMYSKQTCLASDVKEHVYSPLLSLSSLTYPALLQYYHEHAHDSRTRPTHLYRKSPKQIDAERSNVTVEPL